VGWRQLPRGRGAREDYAEKDVAEALSRVVQSIKVLHAQDIVHGNLQITDLVVSSAKELDVTLTNYGRPGLQRSVPMPPTLVPELLNGGTPTKATDIWGLGVLCYVMLVGYAPFALRPNEFRAEHKEQADETTPSPSRSAQRPMCHMHR